MRREAGAGDRVELAAEGDVTARSRAAAGARSAPTRAGRAGRSAGRAPRTRRGSSPTPTPSRNRPPVRRSTSAACLATSAVWRWGRMMTPVTSSSDVHDAGEEAEQHERLVERRRHVVGAAPRRVHRRVGAEHVVVGEDVGEAEPVDRLGVGAHGTNVAAELGLGEDDTKFSCTRWLADSVGVRVRSRRAVSSRGRRRGRLGAPTTRDGADVCHRDRGRVLGSLRATGVAPVVRQGGPGR